MIRFRPLPLMTLFAIIALAVLVTLGRWQYQRYEEKRALAAAPVAEMTIESYRPIEEGIQLVYGVLNGEPGWRVFAPVRYGETNLYVDTAFVPGVTPPDWSTIRFPASLANNTPLTGASIRPAEAPPFTPPPSPADHVWYAVDLHAMARSAGMASVEDFYLATDYTGDDGRPIENPFARLADSDPLPPERHLGYAITWWGLAIVLMGIYFAYHLSVGRLRFGPQSIGR
ncbi:MAG: SURF1 family protein [Hyphomonadaceae bacterium]